MVRRQAEWRYSALSEPFIGTDKLFEVKPATFEDRNSARQNELVLNHQFRNKIDRVKFIDDLVRSVVDDGTGIVQVGWERVTHMVKETVPVYSFYPITTQEQMVEFSAALELREVNSREFNTKLPSAYNQNTVLLPLQVPQRRLSKGLTIVADFVHARLCRIDNHLTGEIVSYGGDDWKVYPFYRKNTDERNGGQQWYPVPTNHSGTFGYAIRYTG